MSTAFDHVCARCRSASEKLFLKGEKCFTPKCPLVRRPYAPGVHGQSRRKTVTEYGRQLREKQALRAIYGIRERQLQKYFEEARSRRGVTADALVARLESRLDTVVHRLGFSLSQPHARQLVYHGFITVNGRPVNVPSYEVGIGDSIGIKEARRGAAPFLALAERTQTKPLPAWLERTDTWTAKVSQEPQPAPQDIPVDLRSVVEFYSR